MDESTAEIIEPAGGVDEVGISGNGCDQEEVLKNVTNTEVKDTSIAEEPAGDVSVSGTVLLFLMAYIPALTYVKNNFYLQIIYS